MTKEEYAKLLKDPRWRDKRLEILERDDNKCTECGSNYRLHVHHKIYEDINPWEYNNEDLITLCSNCHKQYHEQNGNTYQVHSIIYNSDNNIKSENSQIETKIKTITKLTGIQKLTEKVRLSFPTKEYFLVRALDPLIEDIVSLSHEQTKAKFQLYRQFEGDIEGYISISISFKTPHLEKKIRTISDPSTLVWGKKRVKAKTKRKRRKTKTTKDI